MNQKQFRKLKQLRDYIKVREDLKIVENRVCSFDSGIRRRQDTLMEIWRFQLFIQNQIEELADSKGLKTLIYSADISLEDLLDKVIDEKEPEMEM